MCGTGLPFDLERLLILSSLTRFCRFFGRPERSGEASLAGELPSWYCPDRFGHAQNLAGRRLIVATLVLHLPVVVRWLVQLMWFAAAGASSNLGGCWTLGAGGAWKRNAAHQGNLRLWGSLFW